MNTKAIVPLAIGLIVGIFAVSRGLNYIKSVKGSAVSTVPVVTAKTEIPQGVPINEGMVDIKQVSKDLAPARHFAQSEKVIDRVTAMVIPQDMPIMPTMLAPAGTVPGLGAKIPDGMRAVAVRVDEWSAVGGWIKPGVRVDVCAVFAVKDGRKTKSISKIILQNIEVAAVGGTMGSNPQETGANVSRSVTLIVTPKDVSKIHLASAKGKITLAMRSSLDEQQAKVGAEDEDDLFNEGKATSGNKGLGAVFANMFKSMMGNEERAQVQVAEAPSRCTVDLINGARYERRVYLHANSMEQVGDEGTQHALLTSAAKPYARQARRAGPWTSDSPESDDSAEISSE